MLRSIYLASVGKALRQKLATLETKDKDFEQRSAELKKAFTELTADTPEKERTALESAVSDFERDEAAHNDEKKTILQQIQDAEKEIEELEGSQEDKKPEEPAKPEAEENEEQTENRSANRARSERTMEKRTREIFGTRSRAEVDNIIGRNEVKAWLEEYRSAIREKRAIQNVGLTIPEVVLPIIRENIPRFSKLYDRVMLKQLNGSARQIIGGPISEAIWTECCAALNELSLVFYQWEFDCYKVGGYYAVCNANIEDSDLDLAAEILGSFGISIGLALDKSILWGRNIAANLKMPQGVVPSLAQTEQPSGYPTTARAWADLHTSNIVAVGSAQSPLTGAALIAAIIKASACASSKYSRGRVTWCMNDKTYKNIVGDTVSVAADGSIRSAVAGVMPVIGGDMIVLDFLPNDIIVFGYFDLYELVERKGIRLATSEHVRFINDETVYKGTARYDGAPIIREAFGVIKLNGASLTLTDVTFPQDSANAGN